MGSGPSIIAVAKSLIVLTVVLFMVSFFLYIWRWRTFPIAQRFPVLVVIEGTSLALLGLQNLLSIAFPFNWIISDCQYYLGLIAGGELTGMVAITIRIVLVIGKDLRTRALVKREQNNGEELRGVGDRFTLLIETFFRTVAKYLSDFQVACIAVFPAFCVSILICFVVFRTGGIQNTLISDEACFSQVGYKVLLLQAGLFVYLGILLSLGFILILRLQDNFFIGMEIRIFCITLSIMVGLTMVLCFGYDQYKNLVVDSRAYGFIVGGFVIPVTHCAQFAFPVFLSLRNERRLLIANETNQSYSSEAKMKRILTFQELSDALDILLNGSEGRQLFISFLQSEFSVENLFFIESCTMFQMLLSKEIQDKAMLLSHLRMIYDNFLSEKAVSQVNISYKVKAPLISAYSSIVNGKQEIEAELFDDAVKEVRKMLVMDSFQRFRVSQEFSLFMSRNTIQRSCKDASLV
jgi:hypothetical protein